MSIKVFHNIDSDFFTNLTDVKVKDLQFVAEVMTNDLDDAYAWTQNIDEAWSRNANVSAVYRENRSTSIGDVLLKDGVFYIVHSVGFHKVESAIPPSALGLLRNFKDEFPNFYEKLTEVQKQAYKNLCEFQKRSPKKLWADFPNNGKITLMVQFSDILVGIEPDGYAHS